MEPVTAGLVGATTLNTVTTLFGTVINLYDSIKQSANNVRVYRARCKRVLAVWSILSGHWS